MCCCYRKRSSILNRLSSFTSCNPQCSPPHTHSLMQSDWNTFGLMSSNINWHISRGYHSYITLTYTRPTKFWTNMFEIFLTLIGAIHWIHYWTLEVKVFRVNFTIYSLLCNCTHNVLISHISDRFKHQVVNYRDRGWGVRCVIRAFFGGSVLLSRILGYKWIIIKKNKKNTTHYQASSLLVEFWRFLYFSALVLHCAFIFKGRNIRYGNLKLRNSTLT